LILDIVRILDIVCW